MTKAPGAQRLTAQACLQAWRRKGTAQETLLASQAPAESGLLAGPGKKVPAHRSPSPQIYIPPPAQAQKGVAFPDLQGGQSTSWLFLFTQGHTRPSMDTTRPPMAV